MESISPNHGRAQIIVPGHLHNPNSSLILLYRRSSHDRSHNRPIMPAASGSSPPRRGRMLVVMLPLLLPLLVMLQSTGPHTSADAHKPPPSNHGTGKAPLAPSSSGARLLGGDGGGGQSQDAMLDLGRLFREQEDKEIARLKAQEQVSCACTPICEQGERIDGWMARHAGYDSSSSFHLTITIIRPPPLPTGGPGRAHGRRCSWRATSPGPRPGLLPPGVTTTLLRILLLFLIVVVLVNRCQR